MIRKMSRVWTLVGAMSLVFQVGCGEHQPGRQEGESEQLENLAVHQQRQPAERIQERSIRSDFGLRILREHGFPRFRNMPNPFALLDQRTELDEFTVSGNEVLVHNKLFLADPHSPVGDHRFQLFFVLPEDAFGEPIRMGTYTHRILNRGNQPIGDFQPRPLWHDTERHRWYIPLSEIYQNRVEYGENDVRPEDIQVLTLELQIGNRPIQVLTIRYQAVGPLPGAQLVTRTIESPSVSSPAAFVNTVSESGWVVQSEEIVNPVSREFALWVGGVRTFSGELETQIQASRYELKLNPLRAHPAFDTYKSSAALAVNTVRVRRNHPTRMGEFETEVHAVSDSGWTRITLRPNETLILDWIAKPTLGVQWCSLPLPEVRPFQPSLLGHQFASTLLDPRSHAAFRELQSRNVRIEHSIVGGKVSSSWYRHVRLSHAFTTEEIERNSIRLSEEEIGSHSRNGNLVDSINRNYPCQGLFRAVP